MSSMADEHEHTSVDWRHRSAVSTPPIPIRRTIMATTPDLPITLLVQRDGLLSLTRPQPTRSVR
jgi:hypothetical protein